MKLLLFREFFIIFQVLKSKLIIQFISMTVKEIQYYLGIKHMDQNKEIILKTDASKHGVGAFLYQKISRTTISSYNE